MVAILNDIVTVKRREIERAKRDVPVGELQKQVSQAPPPRDFASSLVKPPRPGLIAEVKKASPSAGLIREDFHPEELAAAYVRGGARCLSVLTDTPFFQGSLEYLRRIRTAVDVPLLRKEFILDSYQVTEARAAGADCILLIAECLSPAELCELHQAAVELGMQTLIELYDPDNLESVLATGTRLVGINNRNLKTMETTLDHTFSLLDKIPSDVHVISESGIRTPEDVRQLQQAGVSGMLVGESLMRHDCVETAARCLLQGVYQASENPED